MPEWSEHIRQRLTTVAPDNAREAEIVEELSQYFEDYYAELRLRGHSDQDAIALTLAQLGDGQALGQEIRKATTTALPQRSASAAASTAAGMPPMQEGPGSMFADLWMDLRYGSRMLAANPLFTAVAVLVLALGFGVNTAVFSFANSLFLRPLPVPSPERLVRLYGSGGPQERQIDVFSYPNYKDLAQRSRSFTDLAAHQHTAASLSSGVDHNENVSGELVTGNYFTMMGVTASVGRALLAEDDRLPGAHSVVVISDGVWKRRFGGAGDVVGKSLYLNGNPFTVLGVMPPSFKGSHDAMAMEFWAPMMMHQQVRPRDLPLGTRGWGWLSGTGRLRPGVSIEQARQELAEISRQLQREYPRVNEGILYKLFPASALPEDYNRGAARVLAFCIAIAGVVLLAACANIATILLARVNVRRREVAIRQSLGASRGRLARQWLTEGLLLSLLGAGAGLVLAVWMNRWILMLVPPDFHQFSPTTALDGRMLLFSFGVMAVIGILMGLGPAVHAGRVDLIACLRDGTSTGDPRSARLQAALVVGQVTACVVLLIVSGLLLRSLHESASFYAGFHSDNILLTSLDLRRHGYGQEKGRAFYQQLTERLKALPDTHSVTLANVVPLGLSRETRGMLIAGHTASNGRPFFSIDWNVVGADYFSTLGIPIQEGRPLDERDSQPGARPVAVINETMARQFWPKQSAVGRSFQTAANGPMIEIVGVARDIKYYTLTEDPLPYVYVSFGRFYSPEMTIHVRTAGDASLLKRAVQQTLAAMDPHIALTDTMTLNELRRVPLFPSRIMAVVSSLLGILALGLATIGLYGLISYSVSQRAHEIGVRMALGARRSDVFRLVVCRGLWLTVLGIVVGAAVSAAAASLLSSQLFGVRAIDPATFAGVGLLLVTVAFLACLFPALRATRVDPIETLRYE